MFNILSTFEKMLRCDEAFAYSARRFSGYKMADFSYASSVRAPAHGLRHMMHSRT